MRISPFLLPRLAAHDESAYRDVETTGDVEFAGEVAFLARHLKWTWRRISRRSWAMPPPTAWCPRAPRRRGLGKGASGRLAAGAAEYWTEEDPLFASRVKVEGFVAGVTELRDAVDRLDKRIGILEKNAG